jgi:hypothetical protein
LASRADLPAVWGMAHSLLGARVAPLDELARVHERNPATFLVSRDETGAEPGAEGCRGISGMLGVLYLSSAGESAILGGKFSPTSIRPEWLVGASDVPVASYIWAIAAVGPVARKRMVLVGNRLSRAVFRHLPQYSHAVSPPGERMLRMLGYSELQQGCRSKPTAGPMFYRAPIK